MVRRSEHQSNRMGRPNHDKTTVQMPVPSRPGRHLSATHAPVGPPTGFQRPFEIPMRLMAKIIGVIQVKGGAGRSTLATNLAGELSKLGRTVLVDAFCS